VDNFVHTDIICFSHLRWDFVYQRPQHILSRLAKMNRVFYFEEPVIGTEEFLEIKKADEGLFVVTPNLREEDEENILQGQRRMLEKLISLMDIRSHISWYYSPLALRYSDHLQPLVTIYDCMDELSAFKFAHPALKQMEKELLNKADVVFCGGNNLYNAKKSQHKNIYAFPSSIDKKHFGTARHIRQEPADQASIPSPRFGFYGVIDERFDIELIDAVAKVKPHWHFVLLGPVVKIDPASLPKYDNIHYPGGKKYDELPNYIAAWDVALVPFAMNESTRFISPTKTPEYLAAGKPVISTPIRDVVRPYGENKLVHIVHNAEEFIKAAEKELNKKRKTAWLKKVDDFLLYNSWDRTWGQMVRHIEDAYVLNNEKSKLKTKKVYV